MGFDIAIQRDKDLYPQIAQIADRYFSVDTASSETAFEWYYHNPWIVMTAMMDQTMCGFFDFLPLTSEAITLIETGQLIEENINPTHILPPESMRYARALYFSGIAVRDKGSLLGARCAAALIAGFIHLLEKMYGNSPYLKCIYSNPTTYSGNRIVRHLGFTPVRSHKKNVNGMDLYVLPFNETEKQKLHLIYEKYNDRLVDKIELCLEQMPVL